MQLSTLKGFVEEYLDQADTDAFYKTATITELLNESYRALYNLIGRISPEYVMKVTSGNLSSGDTSITLPSDFLGVYVLEYKTSTTGTYKRSKYYDYQRFGELYSSNDDGEPYRFYIYKYGGTSEIRFLRTIDSDYTYSLKYKTKLITSDLMSVDTDEPSLIPEDYHMWLVYYTVINYLPKDQDVSRLNITKTIQNLLLMIETRMAQELGSLQMNTPVYLSKWRGGSIRDNG